MTGFGVSVRLFDDPHLIGGPDTYNPNSGQGLNISIQEQDKILDALYVDMGLTRTRPILMGDASAEAKNAYIEVANDNSDPEVTDLSKFDFTWKRNDGYIDLIKRAKVRGLTTYFLSPVTLEDWMTESHPEEYVEWAMAIIRRWRDQGVELPYYSIINEPGFKRSGIWSGEYLRDVIKLLGPKLKAEGLSTVLVAPDDVNPTAASRRSQTILSDPVARQYVGAVAFHLYGNSVRHMSQLRTQYNIPLWMTEWITDDPFVWANTVHDMIALYDVSAVDYWLGYASAMRPRASLINLVHSGTQYQGFILTKRYYLMGQYSRFVKPGAERIAATSASASIKATAYIQGSSLVVVMINNSSSNQSVNVSVKGVGRPSSFSVVRTSDTEDWRELPAMVPVGSVFNTTLSPSSVTTLVGTIP
jgi:O-glycosyl hydrolase